jgi:hypothetical protein
VCAPASVSLPLPPAFSWCFSGFSFVFLSLLTLFFLASGAWHQHVESRMRHLVSKFCD